MIDTDDEDLPAIKTDPSPLEEYKPFEKWNMRDGRGPDHGPTGPMMSGYGVKSEYKSSALLEFDDNDDDDSNEESDHSDYIPLAKNPFNKRLVTLSNLPQAHSSLYRLYRPSAVVRARMCSIQNVAKSLDLVRQLVQKSINREIDKILRKYLRRYFEPALANIRLNNSAAVSSDHLSTVCRQILEEAKNLYSEDANRYPIRRAGTPDFSSERPSDVLPLQHRAVTAIREGRKRRNSSGSDSSANTLKRVKQRGHRKGQTSSNRSTPSKSVKSETNIRREAPQWDESRLKADTEFVIGSKANKSLGLGATRGRLYIKHPEVFKFVGDQEDKQWMYERKLMPATGGRTYIVIKEDVLELARSDEYRNSPGLMLEELRGFTVPEWMLAKMRSQMRAMRTDLGGVGGSGGRRQPVASPNPHSATASPMSTDECRESEIENDYEDYDDCASDSMATAGEDSRQGDQQGSFYPLEPDRAAASVTAGSSRLPTDQEKRAKEKSSRTSISRTALDTSDAVQGLENDHTGDVPSRTDLEELRGTSGRTDDLLAVNVQRQTSLSPLAPELSPAYSP